MSELRTAESGPRLEGQLGMTLLAVAIGVAVLAGLLLPIPFVGRVANALGDLAHAPLFCGLALGILCLLDRLRPMRPFGSSIAIRMTLVFAGCFAFGVAIELLQQMLGRTAAVHDVIANGIGILVAMLWYCARQLARYRPHRRWLSRGLLAAAGFALAIALWSPLGTLRDVAAMHWDFPVLASFESRTELQRWYFASCEAKLTRADATSGNFAMEVFYQRKSNPAASLSELKSDWSALKTLEMDVILDSSYAGKSAQLMVKIVDQQHVNGHADTFRRQWTLQPGRPQRIRIGRDEIVKGPDTRMIDLSKIQYVHLVLLEPAEATKLRVDRVRLILQ